MSAIAAINNKSLAFLQRHAFSAANRGFQDATKELQRSLSEAGLENEKHGSDLTITDTAAKGVPAAPCEDSSLIPLQVSTLSEEAFSPHNQFAMHATGFHISDGAHFELEEILAVTLCNSALTYLIAATQVQSGSVVYLRRAQSIYKMAQDLLDERWASTTYCLDYVRLSIYSNLGWIHSHFFEVSSLIACHEDLAALLPMVADKLDRKSCHSFFVNTRRELCDIKLAPAA